MSVPLRITNSMVTTRLMTDIQRSNQRIAQTSNQITSGSKLETAGDDPLAAQKALRLRTTMAETDAAREGVSAVQGWTTATDTALGGINDMVQRAHELVISAGNGSLQAADRATIGQEMSQLMDQMKLAANTKFGDQYVFAGQASAAAPYTPGASDTYAGDAGSVIRPIGPGQSVQVNVTGGNVFGGTPGDGKLFDVMRTTIAHLNGGTAADVQALQSTDITAMNTALQSIIQARSTVGSVATRAGLADDRLQDVKLNITSQLEGIEDTDMAEAITTLNSQKTAYQAALSAGANIIQKSLMDFLR